jgi:hypothetical protein
MAVVTPDIIEIANLLKRERYYRDTGQWCLCRAAFHPDPSRTHINVAWSVAGAFLFLTCRRLISLQVRGSS